MNIMDIINRRAAPVPWVDGEKIPWNDPGLSARILASHLSQETDWASRRFELVDRQVAWVHSQLRAGSRVLDLACGPGFYTQRLWALGHCCVGVDFSPASIEYARSKARETGAPEEDLRYVLSDIRDYEPEGLFDCVMMIFGEINVFTKEDARRVFALAYKALKPGGLFVLEGHTYTAVQETGANPSSWWHAAAGEGLMTERAHICLQENFWDEKLATCTSRYYIIDGETGEARLFSSSMTAYRDADYNNILMEIGFKKPTKLTTKKWPVGAPFEGQMMTLATLK